MKTLFFCLCTLGVYGQDLWWSDQYNSMDYAGNLPTVIVIQGDSVRTYIYDVGYLWWKIESGGYRLRKDTQLIETASLYLINKVGKSYLLIKPVIAIQIITTLVFEPQTFKLNTETLELEVDDYRKVTALTFSIEFKPNKRKMQ